MIQGLYRFDNWVMERLDAAVLYVWNEWGWRKEVYVRLGVVTGFVGQIASLVAQRESLFMILTTGMVGTIALYQLFRFERLTDDQRNLGVVMTRNGPIGSMARLLLMFLTFVMPVMITLRGDANLKTLFDTIFFGTYLLIFAVWPNEPRKPRKKREKMTKLEPALQSL